MPPQPEPIPLHPLGRSALRGLPTARRKLERLGPGGCSDEELVALVLDAGPESLPMARAALDRLGGLTGLSRAGPDDLLALGCGTRRGQALAVALELGRRVAAAWPEPRWLVRSPADVAERLLPVMGHLEREELRVALLNTKNVVTAMHTVYVGNLAGSSVRVGEVYRDAVRCHAAAIVVAHNHPSGDPSPSGEDLRITAELAEAGRLLDIELLDHVVLGHGRWVSLRALGAV